MFESFNEMNIMNAVKDSEYLNVANWFETGKMQTSKIKDANILNIYNKMKIVDSRKLIKYLDQHLASFSWTLIL